MPAVLPAVLPVVLAAGLAGAFYFLAHLGHGVWPLIGIFLVPLWWSLERVRAQGRGLFASVCVGFVFGAVAYAGGHPWLLRLVDVFLGGDWTLGGGLWTAYGLGFAAQFALYGVIYHVLRGRGLGVATAGIAPWVLLEWLQPWPFPVHAGAALVGVTKVVQLADLGGPLLLSSIVGFVNLVVFESSRWLEGLRRAPRRVWWAGGVLLLAVYTYGVLRIAAFEARIERAPALRVGVVQANLGLLEKRTQAVVNHRRHVEQTRALLDEGPVDLVVWPETAFTRALRGPLPVSGRLVQQGIDVPLLFGGTLLDRSGTVAIQYNAALLVGRDGLIEHAYRKNLLIPIAETNPLARLGSAFAETIPHAQHFVAATDRPALALDRWRISVPICYEAVRPAFVRRMIREGESNLLVTLANDAWFGDSAEPEIHLQLARMRAIENRIYLVRATNSGFSAIVDPIGRILTRTPLFETANLHGIVHRMEERPIYTRLGDWPGPGALLWIGVGLLLPRGSTRDREEPESVA